MHDYPAPPHVRLATLADAAAAGEVQLRAWRAGYAALLPVSALDGLTGAQLGERWAAAVSDPPSPAHRLLVAVDDGRVVGFAATSPAGDPDLAGERAGELVMLSVDPDAQRRGNGSRLLHAAVDHLRDDGFSLAVTWALAADDILRGFLAPAGWAPDGAWRELGDEEGHAVKQVRLHTTIA